jgi:hypothetical protein
MPAMTKPVLADPRRSGTSGLSFASSGGDALDMPVLFQLSDLSPSKILTPPAQAKPAAKSAPRNIASPTSNATLDASNSERPVATVAEQAASASAQTNSTSLAASSPALLSGATSASEQAAAPVPDSPTIRERAQMRQRRQAAAKSDWFQTQGKYIIIVFLVALAGTIYAARFCDDSPPPPPAHAHDLDLAGDAGPATDTQPTVPHNQQPQLTMESDAGSHAGENPAAAAAHSAVEAPADAVAETNPAEEVQKPAPVVDAARAALPADEPSPQVNLEAPIARQDDSPVAPSPDESLFPWANRQEERVASRPQPETASSVPMPRANPHYQRGSAGTMSSPPQWQSPAGGSPQLSAPAAGGEQPAAPAYPVTDPARYRNFQLETRWPAPAPAGAAPATYENRVPTAPRTGPRYERTGSGLY